MCMFFLRKLGMRVQIRVKHKALTLVGNLITYM
jgi:hypothetical protein